MFCRSLFVLFVLFLLAIVLSVLLRCTDSDLSFSIFKLFLLTQRYAITFQEDNVRPHVARAVLGFLAQENGTVVVCQLSTSEVKENDVNENCHIKMNEIACSCWISSHYAVQISINDN
jgi:hypothetical protein